LAIDPRSVEAMVGMAGVDVAMGITALTDDRAARYSAAETNAIKAVSLAPDHARAHVVLGWVYVHTNRAAQGIAECEQALALDRNLAGAHGIIGLAKHLMGRAAETEGHVREAFRLSPRDIFSSNWMRIVGWSKLQLGADAEAVGWLRRSIEANRNNPLTHFYLAGALALLGRWTRQGPPRRRGWRSIRTSLSASGATPKQATIRRSLLRGSGSLRACV
jgi:tetratricopeptide (TPR) repeat protein